MEIFCKLKRFFAVIILFSLVATCVVCLYGSYEANRSPSKRYGISVTQGILFQQTAMVISGKDQSLETLKYNTIVLLNRMLSNGKYGKGVREVCENAIEECGIDMEMVNNTPVSEDENLVFIEIMRGNIDIKDCSSINFKMSFEQSDSRRSNLYGECFF